MREVLGMNFGKLLPRSFFVWCEDTPPGSWAQYSGLVFPIVETFHLLALGMLLGSLLIVDLRLLGFGIRQKSAAELARYLEPWTLLGMALMVTTGIPMFMMGAKGFAGISWFFYKMVFLCLAIAFHFKVHRKATASGAIEGSGFGKLAACLSLILWFGVGFAGRAIGFFI